MVVTAEVNAPVPRFPVHIDRLDDERVRVIELPGGGLEIDILRQGPGEIRPGKIVGAPVKNIAC